MKVMVAMDSFKGSLSAAAACAAAAAGIHDCDPTAEVYVLPLSDGGEGLLAALRPVLPPDRWREVTVPVRGPYGRDAVCTILTDGTAAIIEMAQCCGLLLQEPQARDCKLASSCGLGQALAHALALGCTDIRLGLGGSATNDGGAGFAQALGARFYDRSGRLLTHPLCGLDLAELGRIDTGALNPALRRARICGCCDVSHGLLGSQGATMVFGPQKGASACDLELLEQGMSHYAALLQEAFGRDLTEVPGAGAAGGLGVAVLHFCGGQLRPGIDTVLDLLGFEELLQGCDLLLTGEGQLDEQSARGKVVSGVARRARARDVTVVAMGGSLGPGAGALRAQGVAAMFAISRGPMTCAQSMAEAEALLRQGACSVMAVFAAGSRAGDGTRPPRGR